MIAAALGATLILGAAAPAAADPVPASASTAATATSTTATAVAARPFYVTAGSPYSNILSLQYLLNAYGFGTSGTGRYDAGTTASVKRFQAARKLTQDGLAGPITMKALLGGSDVAVKVGWPNPNTVKAAQRQLVKIGYQLPVNGRFDAADAAAVKAVQTKYKIPATGTVDYVTWSYLFNPPTAVIVGDANFSDAFLKACEDSEYRKGPGLSPTNDTSRSLTAIRVKNARFIIAVGKQAKAPAKGIQVALVTAMQESRLDNLCTMYDHDSVGLFQQRVRYYGTGSRNKSYATKSFYGSGGKTSGVANLRTFYPAYLSAHWSVGYTAQKIQKSGVPGAYAKWAPMAAHVYATYAPSTPAFTR